MSSADEEKQRKHLRKGIVRVALVSSIFIMLAGLFAIPQVREALAIENLVKFFDPKPDETFLQHLQRMMIFVFPAALLMAVGMPRIAVSTVAGIAFGAFEGTILGLAASVFGAWLTYLIGRSLLRSTVRNWTGKGKMKRWIDRFKENAFIWTLYMRLFPISNATVTSLFCGCCKVNQSAYCLANLVGFLPLAIVFSVFGSAARKGSWEQITMGVLIFLLVALLQWWYTERMKQYRLRIEREEAEAAEQ